jgi:ferredoxin, 2Fe-2S
MNLDLKIFVTDRDETKYSLEGQAGMSLMEVLRQNGLSIAAECGGACACATCHVYVTNGWFEKLQPPEVNEVDMLEVAPSSTSISRLSCQIPCADDLDGITLVVAPE